MSAGDTFVRRSVRVHIDRGLNLVAQREKAKIVQPLNGIRMYVAQEYSWIAPSRLRDFLWLDILP